MNKEKIQLIETILNDLSIDMINTLYEIVVNNDYDFIENLKYEMEDYISKDVSNKNEGGDDNG